MILEVLRNGLVLMGTDAYWQDIFRRWRHHRRRVHRPGAQRALAALTPRLGVRHETVCRSQGKDLDQTAAGCRERSWPRDRLDGAPQPIQAEDEKMFALVPGSWACRSTRTSRPVHRRGQEARRRVPVHRRDPGGRGRAGPRPPRPDHPGTSRASRSLRTTGLGRVDHRDGQARASRSSPSTRTRPTPSGPPVGTNNIQGGEEDGKFFKANLPGWKSAVITGGLRTTISTTDQGLQSQLGDGFTGRGHALSL